MTLSSILDNIRKVNSQITYVQAVAGGGSRIGYFLDFIGAYVRHGALPRQYFVGRFWAQTGVVRRGEYTYKRMLRLRDRLNPVGYRDVLIEKNLFNRHFADFNHRRWLYAPEATFEEFAEFIETFSRVLIKPVDGYEGEGIRAVTTVGLSTKDKKAFYEECRETRTMVEEIITNHPRMRFGNNSLNTLRVTSMLNTKGEPEIMACLLRAGVGDSIADNYCAGGVIYNVDVKEGIVDERGVRRDGRRDIVRHPGTDIIMLGHEIPRWEEVKEFVKKAHLRVPHLRFIGWDVAITPDHLELIEGNHDSDYEAYSFIGPGGAWRWIKARL